MIKPSHVFDTYWRFAVERQNIFFKRVHGEPAPWTADKILLDHKFTNAYRASDRVSQYMIRSVIYRDDLPSTPQEVFFRTILFKIFNKIETWEMLEKTCGPITWKSYDFERFDKVLTLAQNVEISIFSGAYIMASGSGAFADNKKHRSYLRLLEKMMADELPAKLAAAPTMQQAFLLIKAYPMMGDRKSVV